MKNLNQIDLDALERAIEVTRREFPARAKQIDSMLSREPRERVGIFAASCAQRKSLHLDPWQTEPFRARLPDDLAKPRDDPRGERRAAELLQRLLDAGLSPFEPDPVAALERAEAKPAK
jgi:hypothetical protein